MQKCQHVLRRVVDLQMLGKIKNYPNGKNL